MKQDLSKFQYTNKVIQKMKKIYNQKRNKYYSSNILISHFGNISEPTICSLLYQIENNNNIDIPKTKVKKIFFIIVELLQNIFHHNKFSIFFLIVIKDNDKYKIITANPVINKQKKKITDKLNRLNNMPKEEIDKFYRQNLLLTTKRQSKTAGLGFIGIKRKLKEKINFSFENIDFSNFIFIFEVSI